MKANQELGSSNNNKPQVGSGPALSAVGHKLGVQRDRNLWSLMIGKGTPLKTSIFLAYFQTKQLFCHNCRTYL